MAVQLRGCSTTFYHSTIRCLFCWLWVHYYTLCGKYRQMPSTAYLNMPRWQYNYRVALPHLPQYNILPLLLALGTLFQNYLTRYRASQKKLPLYALPNISETKEQNTNRFFLLKTEIHTQILNTRPIEIFVKQNRALKHINK